MSSKKGRRGFGVLLKLLMARRARETGAEALIASPRRARQGRPGRPTRTGPSRRRPAAG